MKIPKGMTEEDVLESIEIIVKGLAYKYKFGYYDIEDIKQEARAAAIKGLEKYDPEKGKLQTFLWTHVKNQLFNLKRNKYERHDKPCFNCPLMAYDPDCTNSHNQCTKYDDKTNCMPYYNWIKNNSAKKNIMCPVCIQNVQDERESRMREETDIVENLNTNAIVLLLDTKIPVTLRPLWIKMKNDIKLSKPEREKLLSAIREILAEENYDD
jgi:DNA-directed RNA polymerase specialized sigma24 family protein